MPGPGEPCFRSCGGGWASPADIARKRGLARAHSRQSRPADATVRQTKRSDTLREDCTLPGDGASYPLVASGGPQEVGGWTEWRRGGGWGGGALSPGFSMRSTHYFNVKKNKACMCLCVTVR